MLKYKIKTIDLLRGVIIASVFILLSFYSFSALESIEKFIYGIEMRLALPSSIGANKIAIVNIDEKSLDHLGPWPWPRQLIGEMITILNDNGAKLIGLDLLFSSNEQNQGLTEIRDLRESVLSRDDTQERDTWLLSELDEIDKRLDNDRIIVKKVIESGNVVMPLTGIYGGYDSELVLTPDSFLNRDRLDITEIQSGLEDLVSVKEIVTPFQELAENSHGLGHINLSPEKSMKGRTHLLFFNYRGHVIPSMSLRLALDYISNPGKSLVVKDDGVMFSNYSIPAPKGEFLIKYKGGKRSFPYYSFVDILNVKKVPAVFDDKIVLIGYTAEGGALVNTPVDAAMPRVEFTANVVDNLISGRFLQRPVSMIYVEALLILIFTIIFSSILPRVTAINQISITAGLILFFILIGVISFLALDIWFKAVYACLSLVVLYIEIVVRDLIISQKTIGLRSKEAIESNRMLGLSFQSQGLLDLAFEKFRKCPLDNSMKDVVYNLGLDYERKRMINKAVAVYEYISDQDKMFRDLNDRISKLRKVIGALPVGTSGKKEEKIIVVDDLEIKPTVGRYEIVKEVGQGAMGVVYQARDPKINRLIAIKTIRFSDEFEEDRAKEIKARFFKEAEIAGKLSHPSIVAVYDVGEDYDLTYLAMEYIEGADLRDHCVQGSLLPLRKVLKLVSESAQALDYAHANGVVHRDIKPANIMLLKNGESKITDFGIAKAVSSSQTKSGVVLGTPNYMSPEQINSQQVDGRSDIFSLGVVLFELLTGQVPFHGKSITNLLYQITQTRHPSARSINPKVPKVCDQIIDKALTKDPAKRFQKGGDFAKYLNALINRIDKVASNR